MFELFPWDVSATLQKPVCLIPMQSQRLPGWMDGLMLRLQIHGGATTVGLHHAPSLLTCRPAKCCCSYPQSLSFLVFSAASVLPEKETNALKLLSVPLFVQPGLRHSTHHTVSAPCCPACPPRLPPQSRHCTAQVQHCAAPTAPPKAHGWF